VLIAPLDWGLGHATRCIPLIEKLLIAGFKVIIAAEADQKILLQTEFPELEIVPLDGYKLKYGSTKWLTLLKLIFQIPKILTAINNENKWLQNFLTDKHLDIIIADNRYGLQHKKLISVFVTHQLHIKTSLGSAINSIVQRINYHYINQFDYCWVPDTAGAFNLAGELSHPVKKPTTALFYTGVLSRIQKQDTKARLPLLILLSGPEPQRTILENSLLAQLKQYGLAAVLVRGLPATTGVLAPYEGITIYNHLPRLQLQQAINEAEVIVSRSGYSTLMDVLPLGKKCILIPTPGQAEQEYLAARLAQLGHACTGAQSHFSLPELMGKAARLKPPDLSELKTPGKTSEAIDELLQALHKKNQ